MMKNIQNTKRINLSIGYLKGIRYLTTVIFLVFCANLLNAQDLETSLREAAKDLVNPIYAIIEIPQADGTVEYVEILKNDLQKINQLERNYTLTRNEAVIINDSITYLKTMNENSTRRKFQVTLAKNYRDTTYLKMVKAASTRIIALPVSPKTITERVLVKKGYTKLETIPGQYKITADTVLVKAASYENPATAISHKELKIIPAEYEIVHDSTLVAPSHTKEVFVPPVYKTVTKAVVIKPVPDRIVDIPAEYKTVTELSVAKNTKVITFEMPLNSERKNECKTVHIQTRDIIRYCKPKKTKN